MKRGWGKTALLFVALCLIEALAASGEAFALDSGRCVLNARDPPARPAHYAAKVRHPDLDWVWDGFSGILIGA